MWDRLKQIGWGEFLVIVLIVWVLGLLITMPLIWCNLDSDDNVDRVALTIGTLGALFVGTVGLFNLYVNYLRTRGFEEQLKTQREGDKRRDHQQLYATNFVNLGSDSESVRLGAVYGLERLAKESRGEEFRSSKTKNRCELWVSRVIEKLCPHDRNKVTIKYEPWAPKVAEILCAHIRSTTVTNDYLDKNEDLPSIEIANILKVLTQGENNPFDSAQFDLRYSYLVGANLRGAKLKDANMFGINLASAILEGADLRKVELTCADLNLANLKMANLECALLGGTRMIRTNLEGAILSFSDITGGKSDLDVRDMADLRCANLKDASLVGVYLDANLTWANLEGANLTGAFLGGGIFYGASLKNAKIEGCGGSWPGKKAGEIQPVEAFKGKIGQSSNLDCIVGSGHSPAVNVQRDTNRKHQKQGYLKHQTPGDVEERLVDKALVLIDSGRLTDLSGISYGVLTQGLYDAIMMDLGTGKTKNEDQYRAKPSIKGKLTQEEKENLFRSNWVTSNENAAKDNVDGCKWGYVYVLEEKGTQGNSKAK